MFVPIFVCFWNYIFVYLLLYCLAAQGSTKTTVSDPSISLERIARWIFPDSTSAIFLDESNSGTQFPLLKNIFIFTQQSVDSPRSTKSLLSMKYATKLRNTYQLYIKQLAGYIIYAPLPPCVYGRLLIQSLKRSLPEFNSEISLMEIVLQEELYPMANSDEINAIKALFSEYRAYDSFIYSLALFTFLVDKNFIQSTSTVSGYQNGSWAQLREVPRTDVLVHLRSSFDQFLEIIVPQLPGNVSINVIQKFLYSSFYYIYGFLTKCLNATCRFVKSPKFSILSLLGLIQKSEVSYKIIMNALYNKDKSCVSLLNYVIKLRILVTIYRCLNLRLKDALTNGNVPKLLEKLLLMILETEIQASSYAIQELSTILKDKYIGRPKDVKKRKS